MKNFSYYLVGIVLCLFTFSCQNKEKLEVEKINKELIDMHNEVMPRTMGIPAIKEKLAKIISGNDVIAKSKALELATELQKVDDAMNKWMEDFGQTMNDAKKDSEKLEMFKKLKPEIESINANSKSVLEKAKLFLGKNDI